MTHREIAIALIRGFRIEDWPDLFDSPECKVTKENGGYWLTACGFENLDDRQVLESAEKLKIMMAAFAKIELGTDFQSIEHDYDGDLGDIRERVGDKTTMSRRGTAKAAKGIWSAGIMTGILGDKNDNDVGDNVVDGNAVQKEREERLHDYYLNRCDNDTDSNVFDALYYFAEDTSFYSLYKAYETIKVDTDGHPYIDHDCKMVDEGWVEYDDLNAFKKSANCYGVVRSPEGKYGLRHSPAECRQWKQYKGAICSLAQAEYFMRHLLEQWLKSKCT
jgi:hypothetical protein